MIRHLNIEGAEGVQLHAAQSGTEGQLMLFLHGFPEFWQAWHRQLAVFSSSFRAVALDLRGCNLSGKPADVASYELRRVAEDVRRAIRELSPGQKVVLVGHDWGGMVAWSLARDDPALFERLVIINAPHPLVFHRELKHSPAQMLASGYAAFFQLRGVAEATLRAFDFAALRGMVFGMSAKPEAFTPELRAAYRDAWSQPGALEGGLNYYRNIRALRSMAKEPPSWRIELPILVLWGEKDPALRLSNLVGLHEYVTKLSVRRHPRATHWIVHEEPAWVNAAISEFVARRNF